MLLFLFHPLRLIISLSIQASPKQGSFASGSMDIIVMDVKFVLKHLSLRRVKRKALAASLVSSDAARRVVLSVILQKVATIRCVARGSVACAGRVLRAVMFGIT